MDDFQLLRPDEVDKVFQSLPPTMTTLPLMANCTVPDYVPDYVIPVLKEKGGGGGGWEIPGYLGDEA